MRASTLALVEGASGSHITRGFRAGTFDFKVRCSSEGICDTVEALFKDLDRPADWTRCRELQLTELPDPEAPMLALSGFDPYAQGVPIPPDAALDLLVSRVNRLSFDSDPGRLHLHAAALATQGSGVLISAPSGTGKTTLAAALIGRGWGYLSDEMVAVAPGTGAVSSFPKPLTIKQSGRTLFTDLQRHRVSFAASSDSSCQIPASRLGVEPLPATVPSLLVFLSRKSDAPGTDEPKWAPMHPTDSVVSLIEQSIDAVRFGKGALLLVAHLVSRCRSVVVDVGTPAATAELVEALFMELPEPGARPVRELRAEPELAADPRIDDATAFAVPEAVASLEIDRRVVAHNLETGRLASFDEAGSAVWLALLGHAIGQHAPVDESDVRSFLRRLTVEGFSTGAAHESEHR